jgi:hypothetical protein
LELNKPTPTGQVTSLGTIISTTEDQGISLLGIDLAVNPVTDELVFIHPALSGTPTRAATIVMVKEKRTLS